MVNIQEYCARLQECDIMCVPEGFSNVVIIDKKGKVLLQNRIPEGPPNFAFPYCLSSWGGKWEEEDEEDPLEAARREKRQELHLPDLPLYFSGIYLCSLPLDNPKKFNMERLTQKGFTHWLNWKYLATVDLPDPAAPVNAINFIISKFLFQIARRSRAIIPLGMCQLLI